MYEIFWIFSSFRSEISANKLTDKQKKYLPGLNSIAGISCTSLPHIFQLIKICFVSPQTSPKTNKTTTKITKIDTISTIQWSGHIRPGLVTIVLYVQMHIKRKKIKTAPTHMTKPKKFKSTTIQKLQLRKRDENVRCHPVGIAPKTMDHIIVLYSKMKRYSFEKQMLWKLPRRFCVTYFLFFRYLQFLSNVIRFWMWFWWFCGRIICKYFQIITWQLLQHPPK